MALGLESLSCSLPRLSQLATPDNTITYHNALCLSPQNLHKHCLQFLLGVKMVPRETENNAYANFWGDKQRALWYVMVFSGVVNMLTLPFQFHGNCMWKSLDECLAAFIVINYTWNTQKIATVYFHLKCLGIF